MRVSENSDWALVCEPDADSHQRIQSFRGWIPRRYLTDQLKAERDKKTRIQKKAVIVNKEKSPQTPADESSKEQSKPVAEKSKGVQPLLAPPSLADETDARGLPPLSPLPLEMYRLLFVYAEYDGWLLVSPDPQQSQALGVKLSEHQARVVGWVPENRVARWNTRECFQWDRETYLQRKEHPGMLFKTPAEALAFQKTGTLPTEDRRLIEPNPIGRNGNVIPLRKEGMRFHLLLGPKEAGEQQEPLHTEWKYIAQGKNNQLYQIGAVSAAGRLNKATENIEFDQITIDKLSSEAATTEILFVIDDTGSMTVAFQVAARIIEKLAEDFRKDRRGGDVKIGVCFYHDGQTPAQAVDLTFAELKSLKDSTELSKLVAMLNGHSTKGGGKYDPLERVYDGIHQGILKANFSDDSRKLVVLMGDCGENGSSQPKLEDLVKSLIPKDKSPMEFHAIQLKDPRRKSSYETFRRQFEEELKKAYQKRLRAEMSKLFEDQNERPHFEKLYSYTLCDTPADVPEGQLEEVKTELTKKTLALVLPHFEEARELGDELNAFFQKKLALGKLEHPDNVEVAVYAERMLKNRGLEKFGKGEPVYETLYAWEKNRQGDRQLRRMVFVDEFNIQTAIQALNEIETAWKEGIGSNQTVRLVQILSQQVGKLSDVPPELKSDLDRAQWLVKTLRFRSDLFLKLIDPEAYGDPDEQDYSEVFLKRRYLEAILNAKDYKPEDFTQVESGEGAVKVKLWTLKEGRKMDTLERGFERFKQENSENSKAPVKWYYLDYQKEWP